MIILQEDMVQTRDIVAQARGNIYIWELMVRRTNICAKK